MAAVSTYLLWPAIDCWLLIYNEFEKKISHLKQPKQATAGTMADLCVMSVCVRVRIADEMRYVAKTAWLKAVTPDWSWWARNVRKIEAKTKAKTKNANLTER